MQSVHDSRVTPNTSTKRKRVGRLSAGEDKPTRLRFVLVLLAPAFSPAGHTRRGFTLMEMIVAGVLLAAMMTAVFGVVHAGANRQRAVRQRQAAVQEAANFLEPSSSSPARRSPPPLCQRCPKAG
jgi:prepilin-type N-terminal cleavage/methylation domain-containing protein